MATVVNPPVPYNGYLMNGGRVGSLLQINGFIPHHAQQFAVNIKTGHNDIVLHFNPRFSQNAIVMNHNQHGSWGKEEKTQNRLFPGRNFELKILIENDKFMVAIDGAHLCHFHHRLPKEHIQLLEITGDVHIQVINEVNTYGAAPIINPPVPFTTQLHGGCKLGRKIVVQGMGTGDFSINLQNGFEPMRNAGLHFNIRFNERAIVLNDSTNGGWGNEARCGLNLNPGQPFTVEIKSHAHAYEILLNGMHVTQFHHRNLHGRPLHSVDALHITGSVMIYRVDISG